MNPNNGSAYVEVETMDGIKRLPKLPPSDMIRIRNIIFNFRKDQLRQNIKETGVGPKEACEMLNLFDSRSITRSDIIEFALLPDGPMLVIPMAVVRSRGLPQNDEEYQIALSQAKMEVDNWGLSQLELSKTVASLLHVDFKVKEVEEGRPLAPSGESTSKIETGLQTAA